METLSLNLSLGEESKKDPATPAGAIAQVIFVLQGNHLETQTIGQRGAAPTSMGKRES